MRGKILLPILLLVSPLAFSETLRRGLGPEPDSLHIHQAQGLSAINLLRDLREGLITHDPRGRLVPGVASHWEMLDDGRRYRLTLRDSAAWSDGSPLRAEDFVRAWRQAVDPAEPSRNAALLRPVKNAQAILAGELTPESLGIEAVTPNILDVHLEHPSAWFLEVLAHPVSFPLPGSGPEDPRVALVNGPYTLADAIPHARIRLESNPHFHSADSLAIDVVEYLPIEDPASELARYRAGELHITETLPPNRLQWAQEHHAEELQLTPYLGSFWLGINLRRETPLSDHLALRTAMMLAIDRDILLEKVLGGGLLPAWTIVPPGLDDYPEIPQQHAQLTQQEREAQARDAFQRSGWDSREALRVQLRFNTSSQHRRMAVAVSSMWKQVLGVRTELINEEWKVFVNNRRQGVLTDIFRGGWIADYADAGTFLDLFRSDNELNTTFYDNPAFDALMARADAVAGVERATILQEAEQMMLSDVPVIPLYYYVSRHLVKTAVRGFVPNVRDVHLSRYLGLDVGGK